MEKTELGKRFKMIRKHLGLSQMQIADYIETTQNIVSRLERGQGAGTDTILSLLMFYAERIYIDFLFTKHEFLIVEKTRKISTKDIKENLFIDHVQREVVETAVKTVNSSIAELKCTIGQSLEDINQVKENLEKTEREVKQLIHIMKTD